MDHETKRKRRSTISSSSDDVIDLTSSSDEKDDNDAYDLCSTDFFIGVKRNRCDDNSTFSPAKKGRAMSYANNKDNNGSTSNHALKRTMRIQALRGKNLDRAINAAKVTKRKNSVLPTDLTVPPNRTIKRLYHEKLTEFDLGIYTGDGDNASVSTNILSLIAKMNLANVLTCLSPVYAATKESHTELHLSTEPTWPLSSASRLHMLYIMQKDRWSCGFRNLQMMLGSLIIYLPDSHRIRKQSNNTINNYVGTTTSIGTKFLHIPSVSQLQGYMEESWREGFDQTGAKHFNNRVQGKKSKIGALEVSSLLSYMNIDSTVVQFVACLESRSTLGNFVWEYFNRNVDCRRCHQCSLGRLSMKQVEVNRANVVESNKAYSSVEHVHNLLSRASKEPSNKLRIKCCQHSLLPLYLQWEGHSVTIVGIEKVSNASAVRYHNYDAYQLLVFDPLKRGDALKEKLISYIERQSCTTCLSTQCIDAMRLPTKDLVQKDCQVVLCTTKPVSDIKKEAMKDKPQVVTAACEAVERYVSVNKIKHG